jgi:ubiquinol-cytochrome c reductase cytochrome c1 subunit
MDTMNGQATTVRAVAHLVLAQPGTMSPIQFDVAVNDIVNFLAYTAAPETIKRKSIGYWVLGFLGVFAIIAYLLKQEYWKDIKKK